MKCRLLVAFLVAGFVCGLANVSANDSFLNRGLPTTWVHFSSPQELLQVLKEVVPKTFVLPVEMSVPEGMPEAKAAMAPTAPDWGKNGALFGRNPGDKTPFTVRDYLSQAVKFMGMAWSYDAGRDAVVLDFPWHMSDARSNTELMETLLKSVPPEDEKHIYCSTVDPKNDPWRMAFNALLSKPENYPKAWQIRWKADATANNLFPGFMQPINLFTGKILDEIGAAHFIILNIKPPEAVPGESTISYYLFSVVS